MSVGTEVGEVCNRDGCDGHMDSHKFTDDCSCHISPPCHHCLDTYVMCNKCDADPEDDDK